MFRVLLVVKNSCDPIFGITSSQVIVKVQDFLLKTEEREMWMKCPRWSRLHEALSSPVFVKQGG